MSVIKKVTIPIKNLPPVTADNKYLVRYRIVSDDKNRVSQWSPLYTVSAPTITTAVTATSDVVQTGTIINILWDDANDRGSYDIFIKYGTDPYTYHGSSVSKAYTFIKTGIGSMTVLVQVADQDHSVSATLKVFEKTITLI